MIGKAICPKCKGNGYLKALIEEGREEVVSDCFHCNNQGEIAITEDEEDNYLNQHKSERLQ